MAKSKEMKTKQKGKDAETMQTAPMDPKLLVFVGSERGDFAYHTAQLLSMAYSEESILVIDNSTDLDLFKSIKSADGEVAMSGNITFLHDKEYSEQAFFHFAFTIVYLGYMYDDRYIYYADNIVLCSDYSIVSVDKISQFSKYLVKSASDEEDVIIPLFYDKSSTKIKEKVLLDNMGFDNYSTPMAIENTLESRAGYLNLQYNGQQRLSNMGAEYIEPIVMITSALTGMSDRTLFKMAKKG